MKPSKNCVVVIPAFNEEDSVGRVINDIPRDLVREIIVVNNNSTDSTAIKAREMGATVLEESRQGYGSACLKGLSYLAELEVEPEVIVFIDADYSDYPEEMSNLTNKIFEEKFDLVIGSRALGNKEKGSMMPQQVFGNWLATRLLRLLYGVRYSDLGPFRAIKYSALKALNMRDQNYGWTVEMQLKAAKQRLSYCEVPVNYRQRIGVSKITGTVKGTILAGYKIIWTILRYL